MLYYYLDKYKICKTFIFQLDEKLHKWILFSNECGVGSDYFFSIIHMYFTYLIYFLLIREKYGYRNTRLLKHLF